MAWALRGSATEPGRPDADDARLERLGVVLRVVLIVIRSASGGSLARTQNTFRGPRIDIRFVDFEIITNIPIRDRGVRARAGHHPSTPSPLFQAGRERRRNSSTTHCALTRTPRRPTRTTCKPTVSDGRTTPGPRSRPAGNEIRADARNDGGHGAPDLLRAASAHRRSKRAERVDRCLGDAVVASGARGLRRRAIFRSHSTAAASPCARRIKRRSALVQRRWSRARPIRRAFGRTRRRRRRALRVAARPQHLRRRSDAALRRGAKVNVRVEDGSLRAEGWVGRSDVGIVYRSVLAPLASEPIFALQGPAVLRDGPHGAEGRFDGPTRGEPQPFWDTGGPHPCPIARPRRARNGSSGSSS
jgi:hypothetical protein